jgi:hypothetical protein
VHEIPERECPGPFKSSGCPQLEVGVVVTSTRPMSSTAAQNEVVGHDTPVRWCGLSIGWRPHGGDGAPGVVDDTTAPLPSTATHSAGDGHEIAFSAVVPSIVPGVHAELAGAVLVKRLPWLSTAKQRVVLGQLTAVSRLPVSIVSGPDQPPLAGVVV